MTPLVRKKRFGMFTGRRAGRDVVMPPVQVPIARRAAASRDSGRRALGGSSRLRNVIFRQVGEGRPYPDHARTPREWAEIPPRPVRLDQLITTKNVLDLHTVLSKDSTFYGDLFPHVVRWKGDLYLEDGLHRALRAALHQRSVLHVRILELG
jgi:Arc/MetJ family transcription regulator